METAVELILIDVLVSLGWISYAVAGVDSNTLGFQFESELLNHFEDILAAITRGSIHYEKNLQWHSPGHVNSFWRD